MTDAPKPAPAGAPPAKRKNTVTVRPMAPIVPASNISGSALMLVIAIMSFIACLTLGAVAMVRDTARNWENQISREVTIQIVPEDGLDMAAMLEKARGVALSFPGAATAEVLDDEATGRLLEPWLGKGLSLDDLPVPRLVVVTIDHTAPPDFEAMRATLKAAVPQASLDDHRTWVDRLVGMARATELIGFGILGLVMTATILTVVFATRGALSGNRHIVEVLHFVGAEARFVATAFQSRFLFIGLKGASAGGLLAAAAFVAASWWQGASLATPESDQAAALFGRFSIGASGYFGIVAVIAIIGVMTALTSRVTVVRTIREIDRARSDPGRVDGS